MARIRSPFQGRRQRSARYLDDYEEEPYEDDRSMDGRSTTRGGKRMYEGRMPSFKERTGRMAQMDSDPVEV